MKLVNSKVYDGYEVIYKGECMMCGKRITFTQKEEEFSGVCCNFEYKLEPTKDPTQLKVQVSAFSAGD